MSLEAEQVLVLKGHISVKGSVTQVVPLLSLSSSWAGCQNPQTPLPPALQARPSCDITAA